MVAAATAGTVHALNFLTVPPRFCPPFLCSTSSSSATVGRGVWGAVGWIQLALASGRRRQLVLQTTKYD